MKKYRVCTYEVVGEIDGLERTNLVDIIEFDAPEMASGQNVFHLLRGVEAAIEARSEAATIAQESTELAVHWTPETARQRVGGTFGS
jgi:hypothetical protein